MVPGSMLTSTRLTAIKLPNRLVTPFAARIVMSRHLRSGAHRRAPRAWVILLPDLQRRRLPFTDRYEPSVLHLDQCPLLDRVAGVLAVDEIDDRDLAVRAGGTVGILAR